MDPSIIYIRYVVYRYLVDTEGCLTLNIDCRNSSSPLASSLNQSSTSWQKSTKCISPLLLMWLGMSMTACSEGFSPRLLIAWGREAGEMVPSSSPDSEVWEISSRVFYYEVSSVKKIQKHTGIPNLLLSYLTVTCLSLPWSNEDGVVMTKTNIKTF